MNQAWKYTVIALIVLAAISLAITNVVALHAFVAVFWIAGATMLLLALGLTVGRLVHGQLKRTKNPE
jgi:hypothetical protein